MVLLILLKKLAEVEHTDAVKKTYADFLEAAEAKKNWRLIDMALAESTELDRCDVLSDGTIIARKCSCY